MRQCFESATAAKTLAQSVKKGTSAKLTIAVSHTVALPPFSRIFSEIKRALPELQLSLRRGSGPEIVELLKTGEAELAIAGPLNGAWSRLDAFELFDEPFELFVNRNHKLATRNMVDFQDLTGEPIYINEQCEMAEELQRFFAQDSAARLMLQKVPTLADLLTLLELNQGIAVMPAGLAGLNGFGRSLVGNFDLARKVSAFGIAGRRRAAACATLLNMLRAAEWKKSPDKAVRRELH
jgi:DNA-binding transcriptional LysR family regulator